MSDMFNRCNSLISLPDISKWNALNVNNMKGMFNKCNSLISLLDIFKWNTSNVTEMSDMFSECKPIIYHYQIYQNGILLMLKIRVECFYVVIQ